jgi:hypothetical protein
MTRICAHCGYKVENDLLLACPECNKLLGDDLGRISQEEKLRIIKGLKRNVLRDVLFLAGALAIITILSLWGIKEGLERKSIKRIDEQFETPEIQELLEDVARTKTKELMQRQIDPELKRLRKELSEKVAQFEKYQSEMKERLQRSYQAITNEGLKFQRRGSIFELGDAAISQMSRSAYEELLELLNDPRDASLQLAARSEIIRVNHALMNSARIAGVTLSGQGSGDTTIEESDFTTQDLIDFLIDDPDWRFRARSAQLLANKKELGVPEALLDAMGNDENMEVFKHAVRAFKTVTGCIAPDTFEYEYCSEWWAANSETVNEKLETPE